MTSAVVYRRSDLDGTEAGGFVVMNVDARRRNPCVILSDEGGETHFPTLEAAREFCKRARREGGNSDIFVYALVGVPAALELLPASFNVG